MKNFISVADASNIKELVKEAIELKKNPFQHKYLGENKTIGIIFFNASLRTRLSTQKAAKNLGMEVLVMNFTEGYNIETEDGVVMNADTQEHIKEAAAVIGQYCDIIALRSFPKFENRELDYSEHIINNFVKYSKVPVINLESATRHPLQSLADLITIEELKTKARPKVVLTWAPHPRRLPQAVANSFAEWVNEADVDFVVTHPKGYELCADYVGDAKVVYDQDEALRGADFVYAKNWSSYTDYGQILSEDTDWQITEEKMELTNKGKFMHCLPVRRNVIVSDGVLDSNSSVVIQEAGNREFSAQVVIKKILEKL
jgi:N-succinyl-L-ornithine transcarbamylase